MKLLKQLSIALVLILTINSCENEPVDSGLFNQGSTEIIPENFSENFGSSTEANFMGRIFNEARQPLSGVFISIGNETAITDEKGVFIISEASVFEKFAYIKARKQGYIDASRSITPKTGVNLLEIMMLSMDDATTINSGEESTVSLPNGTSIKFDGNFIDEASNSYSGSVQVHLKHLNPTDENINLQMPGMLFGERTNGAARVLETYGMMAVELRSATGEELQLAEGSLAEVTLPLINSSANTPTTIPLWYFDEILGYWKEEGEATLQGSTYVGNVSHFSFWNWDYPYPSVYVCINLVDANGDALPYTPVDIYSPALNSIGTYGFTNGDGLECGLMPQGDEMFLTVPNYGCNGNNFSTLIGPFSADTSITVTVSDPNVVESQLTAQFNDCDNNSLENGYVEIELLFDGLTYVFPVDNGQITLNAYYCSTETGFNLQAINSDTNQISEVVSGNFINPTTDIGLIELCDDAPSEIVALDDGMDGIEISSSLGANNVVNVLDNDTLNGTAVNSAEVTVSGLNLPNGIFLNADGSVDVNENIPTGTYEFEYQICETTAPNNCDTAVVLLFITNIDDTTNQIQAIQDGMDGIEVTTSTGATNVLNVLDNDTLNNEPATPNTVTVSSTNLPAGIFLNTDGSIDVNENTASGNYNFEYTICEIADPNNCSTTSVSLFITNTDTTTNDIVAVEDFWEEQGPFNSDTTLNFNVLTNDTLGGNAVNSEDVSISVFTDDFVINEFGNIIVLDNTPAGTYTGEYQICEIANPNNCSTALVTLTITDSSQNTIEAIQDGMDGIEVTTSTGATNVLNVLDNDTLNNEPATPNTVTVSSTNLPAGIFLNTDGSIDVNENTASGNYNFEYTICEIADPNNCSTTSVSLWITNTDDTSSLTANDDADQGVVGNTQGLIVLNVLNNDDLNGVTVNTNDVNITNNTIDNDYFILDDATGNVSLPLEFTPSGNYSFDYTICEIANPNNCDTASVNINVSNVLIANDDNFDNVDGTNTTSGLFDAFGNDLLNNQEINPTWAVSITELTNSSDYFVLNTNNGTIDQVIANAPAGVYTITYQLCENFTETPNSNCSTATIQITVN